MDRHLSPRPARCLAAALLLAAGVAASAATPAELLAGYRGAAGGSADAQRGQRFFTTRQGGEWSCASCHGTLPTAEGRHAGTGKTIAPLAPGFNPERFTDPAKVEKWFKRNCKDVASRECSAGEKADVMAWLTSLQR